MVMIIMILMIMLQLDAPLPIHDHCCSMSYENSHGIAGSKIDLSLRTLLFEKRQVIVPYVGYGYGFPPGDF
jgi:hypothetical protein